MADQSFSGPEMNAILRWPSTARCCTALVDAGLVVDDEGIGLALAGIDKHDRDTLLDDAFEHELLDSEGHDRDAVDLAFEHTARADFHGLAFIVRGADEDLVTARDSHLFEPLNQFRKEWVCDLGDDQAEQARFA